MQVGVLSFPAKRTTLGVSMQGFGGGYHASLIVSRDLHADVVKSPKMADSIGEALGLPLVSVAVLSGSSCSIWRVS
jgi:hypothetical protein